MRNFIIWLVLIQFGLFAVWISSTRFSVTITRHRDALGLSTFSRARRFVDFEPKPSEYPLCEGGPSFYLVEDVDGDAIGDWNHVTSEISDLEVRKFRTNKSEDACIIVFGPMRAPSPRIAASIQQHLNEGKWVLLILLEPLNRPPGWPDQNSRSLLVVASPPITSFTSSTTISKSPFSFSGNRIPVLDLILPPMDADSFCSDRGVTLPPDPSSRFSNINIATQFLISFRSADDAWRCFGDRSNLKSAEEWRSTFIRDVEPVLPFSNLIDWKSVALDGESSTNASANMTRAFICELLKDKRMYPVYAIQAVIDTLLFRAPIRWNRHPGPLAALPAGYAPPVQRTHESVFSVVILSYNRPEQLLLTLKMLVGLSREAKKAGVALHSVFVVCNHVTCQESESTWPKKSLEELDTRLVLIPAQANSLNNRFILPIEQVTTECILSLDDDMSSLKAQDILFGFAVWQENSDRIVGFPSKSHRYDSISGWQYVPEQYNKYSFILTGAAFYHRFYAWLYSKLPIRLLAMVDEHKNCEDLVFNMVVCSWSKKSNLKVTELNKFICKGPECKKAISLSKEHYDIRNRCISTLVDHFGGMTCPLTSWRADPIDLT